MAKLLSLQNVALQVSKKSCAKYHRHGAVLIKNGDVISSGVNDENHHAEVNAVLRLYRVLCGERKDL